MSQGRSEGFAAYVSGKIYAVGGETSSVEVFDPVCTSIAAAQNSSKPWAHTGPGPTNPPWARTPPRALAPGANTYLPVPS